jgi:iron complex transport system substrate-binding protein
VSSSSAAISRRSLVRLPLGIGAAAAGAGILSSCSLGGASSVGADATGIAFADAEFIDDPLSYEGPTTAKVAQATVRPIAEDPEPSLPVTLTDSQGTEVTVEDISRILAIDLYGSTARVIFDLGLGDNVIGRDTSSQFEEILDRPLVTQNGHELNGESILELAPTLIITDSSLGPWDVILQMRDSGIPVVVVDSHRSIDGTPELIQQVADAVGVPELGVELAERTAQEVEATRASIAEVVPSSDTDRLRMMFFYARGQSGTYYIFGEGSGADDLITSLGGIDVAAEIGWDGMQPMTDEAFLEASPDLLLMMTKGLESCGGVDGMLDMLPAIALTPAGQKRRVVDMSDTEILSFGPATAAVLEALTVAVYAPESALANTSTESAEQ